MHLYYEIVVNYKMCQQNISLNQHLYMYLYLHLCIYIKQKKKAKKREPCTQLVVNCVCEHVKLQVTDLYIYSMTITNIECDIL